MVEADAGPGKASDFGDERVTLQIKMNRSFSAFGEAEKAEYLADLAAVAGCAQVHFTHHVFIKACVKHELELPAAVARRLLQLTARLEQTAQTSDDSSVEADIEREALQDLRAFLEKHFVDSVKPYRVLSVQVLEESPQRVAVFVHGWRGDADSFGQMPRWLEEETGWRSGVFSYPTGLWQDSPSISLVAASLDNWIHARFPGAELAVIAHSMGGVVARKMLSEQHLRDDPMAVRLAVMCASPHTGTLASLVRKIPTLDSAQLRELDPDSPFLFDLNRHWQWWVHKHQAGAVAVRSVIAQADQVVSLNSAAGLDLSPLVVLEADHRSVVKPPAKDALIMQSLVQWIRQL